MPRFRNAFKIRAADAASIETSQFLQLYSPLLLNQLQHDDIHVPKLLVLRGSPGSGKSSLLRLFETETLLEVHAKAYQQNDRGLVDRLTELGVLSEQGPKVVGIYIQCDSSLRDMANLSFKEGTRNLFNALLDVRIVTSFLRSVRQLLKLPGDCLFEPLPSVEAPPRVFSQRRTLDQLEEECREIEQDFGVLLNSFPGDPVPSTIQPHARLYALSYLALQLKTNSAFRDIVPLVMLDDVQDLYPDQRKQLMIELLRRAAIPRWLAIRSKVFELEDLISLEGSQLGREYRTISLDEIFQEKRGVFPKFSENVIHRRLQATEFLQQTTSSDFKGLLPPPDEAVSAKRASDALSAIEKRVLGLEVSGELLDMITNAKRKCDRSTVNFEDLLEIEKALIIMERHANRRQLSLFPEIDISDSLDNKTEEAAKLFTSRHVARPYYFGLQTMIRVASDNIEQLLSTTAAIVDRMIYRAELDRDMAILAPEQEKVLRICADDYYETLEEKHHQGSAIKIFADNLGRFCEEKTYKPNAPIAPGVNGFGLSRRELREISDKAKADRNFKILREVLTNAVAGNVFSAQKVKQGSYPGRENIVFYLNRLLCVRSGLPLNKGGWQRFALPVLIRMMQESLSINEMSSKSSTVEVPLLEAKD